MKRFFIILSLLFAVLVAAGGIAGGVYWYTKYQKVITDPKTGSEEEVKMLVQKLSKFMELPAENPTVVTITDRDKLQNQEFFQKAQNGDKIIIYQGAKRIILYRPATGRVVDVAPLVFNDQNAPIDINPESLLPTPTEISEQPATPSATVTPISTSSASY